MADKYDARDVTTIVDGVVMFGFSDGDMVTTSKDNTNFEVVSDAQGRSSVAINNDKVGTITLNLAQTSPCYAQLIRLANKKAIFPIYVINGSEKIGGTEASIEKVPDTNYGKSVGNRAFVFKVLDYKHEA